MTGGGDISETRTYSVPGMHCGRCTAVTEELQTVAGVEQVDVDLDTKRVTVSGTGLEEASLRAAIEEAGYEVEEVAA